MNSFKGIGGHHSAKAATVEWLTPRWIIERLGPFDLDPCAPVARPWAMARRHFTKGDDGLSRDWTGRVWLNPPYGSSVGSWLKKLADHGNGIALIFARTETRFFFEQIWARADSILFIRGRLSFCFPDGTLCKKNSGAPSALAAYGAENVGRLAGAQIDGRMVNLKHDEAGREALADLAWAL